MMQHDHDVGAVLDFLKENGLDENTIVWYSTDNGPEHASWPHGGTTPFRGAKMGTFEGGMRVVSMVRWPGVIEPNQTLNGIQTHMDMFTTLAAAAGVEDVNEKMKQEKKQAAGPDGSKSPAHVRVCDDGFIIERIGPVNRCCNDSVRFRAA